MYVAMNRDKDHAPKPVRALNARRAADKCRACKAIRWD